jgi:hypothetical protein
VLVRLNKTNDPPVTMSWWGEAAYVTGGKMGSRAGEPFSTFMFGYCWTRLIGLAPYDDPTALPDDAFFLYAQQCEVGPIEVDYLIDHFRAGPHRLVKFQAHRAINPFTEEEMSVFDPSMLLFFNQAVRIEIQCQGNPTEAEVKAEWRIHADSSEGLFEAATRLSAFGLSKLFRSSTKNGAAVLRKLRRRASRK